MPDAFVLPRSSLIVSCQAAIGSPMDHVETIVRIARAAVAGGADGLRLNGPAHVQAVRRALPETPIIGILKVDLATTPVRITPTLEATRALAAAGSSIIAVDATTRPRPGLPSLVDLITAIRDLGVVSMGDVDTRIAAERAISAGADAIATTLAGYTDARERTTGPDLALISELADLRVPIVAEGRFSSPEQVREAIDRGAFSVVVGTAITDPLRLTERFRRSLTRALPRTRMDRIS